VRSLTPLYLARVASFVLETQELGPAEVDEKIEGLCRTYESMKPYLIANWFGGEQPPPARVTDASGGQDQAKEVQYDRDLAGHH
jgi:hypothetical protein